MICSACATRQHRSCPDLTSLVAYPGCTCQCNGTKPTSSAAGGNRMTPALRLPLHRRPQGQHHDHCRPPCSTARGAVVLTASQSLLDYLATLGLSFTARLWQRLLGSEPPLIPAVSALLLLPVGADEPHAMLLRNDDTPNPEPASEFYAAAPVLTLPRDSDRLIAVLRGRPG